MGVVPLIIGRGFRKIFGFTQDFYNPSILDLPETHKTTAIYNPRCAWAYTMHILCSKYVIVWLILILTSSLLDSPKGAVGYTEKFMVYL